MVDFDDATPRPPLFFFFNDTATTEIYTLSLHDALPIFPPTRKETPSPDSPPPAPESTVAGGGEARSEEHTSELQSQSNLVCRLLLEKKKLLLLAGAQPNRSRDPRFDVATVAPRFRNVNH